MENRIKDYSISGNSITLPRKTGIEDIRLIYNETQKILICSTAKKDNLSGVGAIVVNNLTNTTLINVPTSVCVLQPNDQLTIKCDYGDEGATESTLNSAKEEIVNAVGKGAKESTLLAESAAIKQAIAEAKPEVDLSVVAKQGGNTEATNSKILEELQKVSSIDTDILQGKIQIASAISSKGVPTLFTDSLQNMANKVGQIKQEVIVGSNGFEQMVVPSQYLWNVYSVAQDLMNISSARVEYLPLYMVNYVKGYAVNSFCVAEYINITELQLLNADGYLTSDGHFYTHANGVVTHTFPSGEAETYEAETLVHTFEIDKDNVWVAYFYFNAGYTFTNGDVTSPNRLAICGICASVSIIGTNNLMNLWIIGELSNINCQSEAQFGTNVCIRNYKNHASGAIFRTANTLVSVSMPELETTAGDLFLPNPIGNASYEPFFLNLPKLHTIASRVLFLAGETTGSMNRIKKIYLPKLVNLNVPLCSSKKQIIRIFQNLTEISLPILEIINITSGGGNVLNNNNGFIESNAVSNGRDCYLSLEKISLPKLRKSNVLLLKWWNDASYYQAVNLIDIEVGEYEESLDLSAWIPDNVLADAELTAQLDKNIREHIAMKVQDRTDNTALTLTLSQKVRNILTEETEAVFAAKNWNISPAKSV